jgi:CPA1 family monovalent cation:H+ antiporter
VPGRLGVLVEGESLLNDGTAIVLFAIVLDYARGGPFHPLVAVLQFVRVVGIGVLAGAAVGFIASQVIRQVDDAMIEITVTTLAAYGSFAAGDALHGSGVIATVAAGMLCGNYIAFALNSVVFLLIGFEVRLPVLLAAWRAILAAFVAVTIGRALLILAVTGLLRRTRERLPLGWSAVLTWGGLRGGLSMVLALALPQGFPHRDLLVAMTFGVVLISILLQGLTMAPLIRRLGIASSQRGQLEYEQHRAAALAARAALDALPPIAAEQAAPADLVGRLRSEYEASVQTAEHALEALHLADDDLRGETERVMRRTLLLVERDALLAARRRGVVAGEAYDKAAADVDVRLSRLESAGDD